MLETMMYSSVDQLILETDLPVVGDMFTLAVLNKIIGPGTGIKD